MSKPFDENKLNILWSDYYTLRIVRPEMKPISQTVSDICFLETINFDSCILY